MNAELLSTATTAAGSVSAFHRGSHQLPSSSVANVELILSSSPALLPLHRLTAGGAGATVAMHGGVERGAALGAESEENHAP
jgi:hypothetical protein